MKPVMYLAQGTCSEVPQRTHPWNHIKLHRSVIKDFFHQPLGEGVLGDPDACDPYWYGLPRFHVPILGGWRQFVVFKGVTEEEDQSWHIGWFAQNGFVGISRVQLRDKVRMTIGPKDTQFFALTSQGYQIPLIKCGEGHIGEAGEFSHIPLL
jgi:hypothetical protein